MQKKIALLVAAATLAFSAQAAAHCQVPCGIYDDPARIQAMREDATTITKAVKNIMELSGQHDATAQNQATRWILTKEEHATRIIDVVSAYFLTQKVKAVAAGAEGYDAYLAGLADHHAVMRAAMKTKQTVSVEACSELDAAIEKLAGHYQ